MYAEVGKKIVEQYYFRVLKQFRKQFLSFSFADKNFILEKFVYINDY